MCPISLRSYNMSIYNPATEKQKRVLAAFGYSRTELKTLSFPQASALIDHRRNNGPRSDAVEQETIEGGKLLEEDQTAQKVFAMARIPTWPEVDEITKDMSPKDGLAIEEAIGDLKDAVQQGEKAVIEHGKVLARLRAVCKHGEWKKLLKLLCVPRATAHRQIQLANAHGRVNANLEEILELKGIKLRPTMTASELQIVQKAAEIAEAAEKEAQMSHRETFDPEDGHWQALGRSFERDKQIEAVVKQKVGAFIDSQLPRKQFQALIANRTQDLRLPPTEAQTIAWDIGGLVMGRLIALVPSDKRSEVWGLVVEYVEGEGGLRRNEEEVGNARI
jgi:hypothetical protein